MGDCSTGTSNVSVGYSALGGITTGSWNTAIGYNAANANTTGGHNVTIGNNAQPSTTTAGNQFTLGDGNIHNLRCADTSISALSDERDKTNIVDIPLGLSFINSVRPVSFTWNRRDGIQRPSSNKDFGFIAQELKTVADATDYADHMRLVQDDNPDKLEADPMKMFPILVKAIQELSTENEALKARLTAGGL